MEIDSKTSICSLADRIKTSFDQSTIDTGFMWTNNELNSIFVEEWERKIGKDKINHIANQSVFSELMRELRTGIRQSSFFKHLPNLLTTAVKINKWPTILRPMLKCIILHLESLNYSLKATNESDTKSLFEIVDEIIKIISTHVQPQDPDLQ